MPDKEIIRPQTERVIEYFQQSGGMRDLVEILGTDRIQVWDKDTGHAVLYLDYRIRRFETGRTTTIDAPGVDTIDCDDTIADELGDAGIVTFSKESDENT